MTLSAILLSTALPFSSVEAQTAKETEVDQVRTKVQKIGVGRNSRVEVKLEGNTKVKGYVSKIESDSFTVTDLESTATQTIEYAQVTQIKTLNGGSSKRAWIIIGAAAVAAIIVGVAVAKPALCDGGAGC